MSTSTGRWCCCALDGIGTGDRALQRSRPRHVTEAGAKNAGPARGRTGRDRLGQDSRHQRTPTRSHRPMGGPNPIVERLTGLGGYRSPVSCLPPSPAVRGLVVFPVRPFATLPRWALSSTVGTGLRTLWSIFHAVIATGESRLALARHQRRAALSCGTLRRSRSSDSLRD